jgi:hypothetical protein
MTNYQFTALFNDNLLSVPHDIVVMITSSPLPKVQPQHLMKQVNEIRNALIGIGFEPGHAMNDVINRAIANVPSCRSNDDTFQWTVDFHVVERTHKRTLCCHGEHYRKNLHYTFGFCSHTLAVIIAEGLDITQLTKNAAGRIIEFCIPLMTSHPCPLKVAEK